MAYPTYSQQALSRYPLPRLKRIAAELGVTPAGNKTQRQTWVDAITAHQSAQLQRVDEQALAQTELNSYIAEQAEAVAAEALRTVEISFYDHEIYCGKELIATITHDDADFVTQPWVVMVEGVEKFRHNSWARCNRYIQWHHQDGTLNEELSIEPKQIQAALPAQEQELCTSNEVMAQIFVECEKYGFNIGDDGIYRDDQKLGEVGCTSGQWWVIRAAEGNRERVACDSALEAVWWLSMEDVSLAADTKSIFDEYFLDKPLEQLTSAQLQRLLNAELVTA